MNIPRPPHLSSIDEAQRFMLSALAAARQLLPARAAKSLESAERWNVGGVEADAELAERVQLWESLGDDSMARTPEVLRIRAVICVLYSRAGEVPDVGELLEYFSRTFVESGLPIEALYQAGATSEAA
jgi:hypothetical protein